MRVLGSPLIAGLGALLALPAIGLLTAALGGPSTAETWRNYLANVLPSATLNSLILVVGVALGTMTVGTGAAWLVERYSFRGRDTLAWMLMLPLAIPAYVSAYAITDAVAYAGPVQSGLRRIFGWEKGDYWFPDFHSLGGGIVLFTLALYPYVYLLARDAFGARNVQLVDAARTLGLSARQAFWRVAIPAAHPAIIGGALLVMMETLADFGAVSYLGIDTFTVSIFRSWFNMGDKAAAAQLSLMLLAVVVVVVLLERQVHRNARFALSRTAQRTARVRLTGRRGAWVALLCALPCVLGFLLPIGLLLRLMFNEGSLALAPGLGRAVFDALRLASLVALIAVCLATAVGLWLRRLRGRHAHHALRLSTFLHRGLAFGYAVPGAVLAVGLLTPLAALDRSFGSLLLTGSIAAAVIGALIRFYGVAANGIDAALARLPATVDDATRAMGVHGLDAFKRVYAPILSRSLGTCALLVFVDTLKELPATLSLRPFNFDTLATLTYTLTKDERLAEAALPSLLIVAISVVPIIILNRRHR
jgi:iron(III) transport system permease protein